MRRYLWKSGCFRNADDGQREIKPKVGSNDDHLIQLNYSTSLRICRDPRSWKGFVFTQCHSSGKMSFVRLKMPQVIQLLWESRRIDDLLYGRNPYTAREQRIHLGANIFASVNKQYEGVSVRKWYTPEGQNESLRPGLLGVLLPPDAWRKLYDVLDKFVDYTPHHANDMACS